MYFNKLEVAELNVEFDENICKQTVRKRNFFITRVLQKGTKPSEDKFFLSQIMVQNGEDVNITVKYCDNYKIYYYTEDKSTRITIEKIEEMNKNITNILSIDISKVKNCPTIVIDENDKFKYYENNTEINKEQIFEFKQKLKPIVQQFFKSETKISNGIDLGVHPMLFKLYIAINTNLKSLTILKDLSEVKNENSNFFKTLNSKLNSSYETKSNFVIIPIIAKGHISTMLVDLRKPEQELKDRLYSFDSSLFHFKIAEDHKSIYDDCQNVIMLNQIRLQSTGCCGYWTSCFIEECSKIKDIEEIKKQFKTGEMQLKVACKVSEIIDMNRHQHNIGFIKQIHLPLQITDEISSGEYEASDFIEIKVKDTNKCFLLDRKNICKSNCIWLKEINKLLENNKNLVISEDDRMLLSELEQKQNTNLAEIIVKTMIPIEQNISLIQKDICDTFKSGIEQIDVHTLKLSLKSFKNQYMRKPLSTELEDEKLLNKHLNLWSGNFEFFLNNFIYFNEEKQNSIIDSYFKLDLLVTVLKYKNNYICEYNSKNDIAYKRNQIKINHIKQSFLKPLAVELKK